MLKNCCYDDIWGETRESSCCHDKESIPLDFIQVLIHQHAKTLVALKSLQSEVSTLKNSSSLPQPLRKKPPLLPFDSGIFPTSSGDELYSLLSQIESKLTNIKSKSQNNHNSKPLGYLDAPLGNDNFDFLKFKNIDKKVIKLVLDCDDVGELKRQLLFCRAKLETEENKKLDRVSMGSIGRSLIPVRVGGKKGGGSKCSSNLNSGGGNLNNNNSSSSKCSNLNTLSNVIGSKKFLFSQWFN